MVKKGKTGIRIERLKVPCVVGVYAAEREDEQNLLLDIDISLGRHPKDLAAVKFLDYAGLSSAVSFLCRSAHFGLLEEALVTVDSLIWSLIPAPWVPHACITIEIRKPDALSQYATPVVYGQTHSPSQKHLFVPGTHFRLARLTHWEGGTLWSLLSQGQHQLSWASLGDAQFFLTAGQMLFSQQAENQGQCFQLSHTDKLSWKSGPDAMEALFYLPTLETPQLTKASTLSSQDLWRENTYDLFASLGIPRSETLRLSELIWAKAPRHHFVVEPQNELLDIDAAPKDVPPFVTRLS